jgi:hypothetical protein
MTESLPHSTDVDAQSAGQDSVAGHSQGSRTLSNYWQAFCKRLKGMLNTRTSPEWRVADTEHQIAS